MTIRYGGGLFFCRQSVGIEVREARSTKGDLYFRMCQCIALNGSPLASLFTALKGNHEENLASGDQRLFGHCNTLTRHTRV